MKPSRKATRASREAGIRTASQSMSVRTPPMISTEPTSLIGTQTIQSGSKLDKSENPWVCDGADASVTPTPKQLDGTQDISRFRQKVRRMNEELTKWFASLGIGGIIAAILFVFYRKDVRMYHNLWMGQSKILAELIKENTAAFIELRDCVQQLRERRQRQRRSARRRR